MSEKFSSTLRIGDLNDFIAPSQACIVSVKVLAKSAPASKFGSPENAVRKIKSGKCDYNFVEVMACPSGCLNDGGQIKPQPRQTVKNLIEALKTIYMEKVRVSNPFKNPHVRQLYDEWLA